MQHGEAGLRIDLTGQVTISDEGRDLGESELPGRQGRLVLARLALAGGPVHRDVLADALWPQGLPATWERTLSGVVSRLRSTFSAAGFEQVSIANAFGNYELQLPPGAQIDVRAASALVEGAERSVDIGDLARARTDATEALAIARQPLLAGEDGDWLTVERDELQALLVRALDVTAAATLGSQEAVASATEALGIDPFRETSYVLLMRAHAAIGNVAEALLAYERCRERLADELGVDPSEQTQALQLELLRMGARATEQRLEAEGLVTLPRTSTAFIGRTRALDELSGLLGEERLITLTGAGGAGKTRLAVELARACIGMFTDGVHLVDLSALARGSSIGDQVALALRLVLPGGATPVAIAEVVARQRILLVFDNCEHLLDDAGAFIGELIARTHDLAIVATSTTPLSIAGERAWRVPSLALPADDDDGEALASCESVALFKDRASAVRPGFDVTAANAETIGSICRRLDGIPLAIELTATRLASLSLSEIDERLDERLLALAPTERSRSQTLRMTIDWSYDLLGRRQAEVLRACAVFEGGFTADDANAVCDADGASQLAALATRSLLSVDGEDDAARYRMLETVKAYVRERADGTDEWDVAIDRHVERYASILSALEAGGDLAVLLAGVRSVRSDATTALERALTLSHTDQAVSIARAQWRFWQANGLTGEGRSALERTTSLLADDDRRRGELLIAASALAFDQADLSGGEDFLAEAIELASAHGDEGLRSLALATLASFRVSAGDLDGGAARATEALEVASAIGAHLAEGQAAKMLAVVHNYRLEYDECIEMGRRAIAAFVRAGDLGNCAKAQVIVATGHPRPVPDQEDLLQDALANVRTIGDRVTECLVLQQVGITFAYRDENDRALDALAQALRLGRRIGHVRAALGCVHLIALVDAELDVDPVRALTLIAGVLKNERDLGLPSEFSDEALQESLITHARGAAGARAEDAWAHGEAMSVEALYQLASTVTVEAQAPV